MTSNLKNIFLYFCAFYVLIDISGMILEDFNITTKDETCRNQIIEKYYAKHGSLEHFSKIVSMSDYVLMNGTLDGFNWNTK